MKLLSQFGIIFGICWVSTLIEAALPFAMPASIIGMLILLVLLATRVVRPEHVQEKSDFLLANLPFFFIPAAVSIMNYTDVLQGKLVALLAVCILSMVVTFAVTAAAVQITCRLLERRRKG